MILSPETAQGPTEEGLRRKLVPRQIAMMAMGSAIGVGLLLGSAVTIRLAGPGVIVTYIFGALTRMVLGAALPARAAGHPAPRSVSGFSDPCMPPWSSCASSATY